MPGLDINGDRLYICSMEIQDKLNLIGGDSRFEVDSSAQAQCGDFVGTGAATAKTGTLGDSVSMLVRSDGKRVPVLKTLLSSYCARNCFYCPWRRGRDLPRVHIQPQLDDHSRLDESTFLRLVFNVMFHRPTGWLLLNRLSASCYLEPTRASGPSGSS